MVHVNKRGQPDLKMNEKLSDWLDVAVNVWKKLDSRLCDNIIERLASRHDSIKFIMRHKLRNAILASRKDDKR